VNTLPLEVTDPLTGELIDTADRDALIAAFGRLRVQQNTINCWRSTLVLALATHCRRDESRTAYVRGERAEVRLEFPPDSWDQQILKEAYHSYPQFRDQYLTVASVRVKLREWMKAKHTVGSADWEQFQRMLREANLGLKGLPRVSEVGEAEDDNWPPRAA
jgi:hypothetical protein